MPYPRGPRNTCRTVHSGCSAPLRDTFRQVAPVGTFPANPHGAFPPTPPSRHVPTLVPTPSRV
eukprot:scaffold177_cov334-Pavlova_lutheri.AAC.52